jgi:hypothetical protein
MFIAEGVITMRLIHGLGGDIPVAKTLESIYSPFFDDFDRSRGNLPKKIGITLIF